MHRGPVLLALTLISSPAAAQSSACVRDASGTLVCTSTRPADPAAGAAIRTITRRDAGAEAVRRGNSQVERMRDTLEAQRRDYDAQRRQTDRAACPAGTADTAPGTASTSPCS